VDTSFNGITSIDSASISIITRDRLVETSSSSTASIVSASIVIVTSKRSSSLALSIGRVTYGWIADISSTCGSNECAVSLSVGNNTFSSRARVSRVANKRALNTESRTTITRVRIARVSGITYNRVVFAYSRSRRCITRVTSTFVSIVTVDWICYTRSSVQVAGLRVASIRIIARNSDKVTSSIGVSSITRVGGTFVVVVTCYFLYGTYSSNT